MKGQNLIVVRAWIEKADHDLGSAKVIFQHIPEYSDTIADEFRSWLLIIMDAK
jgi:hypothetical protein